MHGMLNRALLGPATLQLTAISMEQAESLLAAIWCVLEAHAVASPTLEVSSAADLIDISLTFRSAEDCSLIRGCWQSARRRPRQARLPPHRPRAIYLAPQMAKAATVPTSNVAERLPIKPEPAPHSQASEPGQSAPLTKPERASRRCRFIIGNPSDFHALGEAIYCGCPVERIGEPWCAEHRRICYVRPRAGGRSGIHNVV
jgi:hypothetical protein